MALFRRKSSDAEAEGGSGRLADDAPRMRSALAAMAGDGSGPLDLRALTDDLLSGEVAAPTGDVARLVRRNTDPAAFYEKEIAPSWEGLAEAQRAARLEGFLDLARMLDEQGDEAGLPEEMAATVHTKTLLLAFAFDETYGFIGRIASGRDAE
jgi:hypothetical protein